MFLKFFVVLPGCVHVLSSILRHVAPGSEWRLSACRLFKERKRRAGRGPSNTTIVYSNGQFYPGKYEWSESQFSDALSLTEYCSRKRMSSKVQICLNKFPYVLNINFQKHLVLYGFQQCKFVP